MPAFHFNENHLPRFQPAVLMVLRWLLSISKGSACIVTTIWYSSANSEGTRHEYEQVKPQP